jgi:hypothetical protein
MQRGPRDPLCDAVVILYAFVKLYGTSECYTKIILSLSRWHRGGLEIRNISRGRGGRQIQNEGGKCVRERRILLGYQPWNNKEDRIV